MATIEELQAEIAHLKRDVAELKNRLIWGSRRGLGPQSIVSDLDITGDFGVTGDTGLTGALGVAGDTTLTGDLDVAGQAAVESNTYPPLLVTRDTTTTNITRGVALLQAKTSGNAADGFGPSLYFGMEDDAASPQGLANIQALRDGADNTGKMLLRVHNAGTEENALTLDTTGVTVPGDLGVTGHTTLTGGAHTYETGTIAQNGYVTFDTGLTYGALVLVGPRVGTGVSLGIVWLNDNNNASGVIAQSSTTMATANTALNGTTGSVNTVTLSLVGGTLYVENRLSYNINLVLTVFGV